MHFLSPSLSLHRYLFLNFYSILYDLWFRIFQFMFVYYRLMVRPTFARNIADHDVSDAAQIQKMNLKKKEKQKVEAA